MSFRLSLFRHFVLALCCSVPLAATAESVELRVASQLGTEPKFLIDESSGRITGICIDIMRAVERADPGLKFVGVQRWMPLVRITTELSAGLQDAACALQRTPERERKFTYLQPALYPVDFFLLARMDDPVVVNSWEDVRSLRPASVVLVNRGFGASATLQAIPGIVVDSSTTETRLNLEKLIAGRARLYFHRGPGIARMLAHAGVTDKVRVLPTVMLHAEFHFVLGKHVAPATANRLRRVLAAMEQSGELKAIYRKWD
ncbi:substrate-binding periplasmic protein [Pseudoduganella aquatica]|uniref:substrate-binding periplasmic protein n=1 Tax=Pseudoduganella aquatica TaxID=2660641 RepID=UPI001E4565AE|nr:ABC transporter substrate-binding protein [Pseudoduganella aquatica]